MRLTSMLAKALHLPKARTSPRRGGYPGDFTGEVEFRYRPDLNGEPDPGEIVWTWVPYEENPKKGKDRPVIIIGRDNPWLLCLALSSKDHDRDAADEARFGRHWMDIGRGDWDTRHRPSEVRLDRIIRVHPAAVRREGSILDRRRFDKVEQAVKELKGW